MRSLRTWLERRRDSAPFVASLAWILVYAAIVISGQRFDTRYLNFGWQLVPWDTLSSNPWSSVWYLHIQPPLWNLVLGVSAWISPLSDSWTLQVVMFGFGILAVASAATLAERLGLGRRAAIGVALIATLHPEVLKGAFEPTYELAVAALLLSVLAVVAGLDRDFSRRRTRLLVLAALVTAVSMTRSLYHPVWALVVLGLALWSIRRHVTRQTVLVTLAVPVIVMGGWMTKNEILFDQANLSSWFGMNLQRAVIPVLDLEDLQAMREREEVSEVAMIGPFGKYALYEDAVDPCTSTRNHRALSEPMRTTDQWSPNFNYECYLPIFDQAGRDAWAVIREHPRVWLEGRLWSLRSTASVAITPSESASFVMRGLDQVYSWARLDYAGVLSTRGWGTPIYGQLTAPVDFGLVLIPLYSLVALAGVHPLWSRVRRRCRVTHDSGVHDSGVHDSGRISPVVLVVASLTIVFTVVIGAIAELGEQARFRTMTDPLALVVGAAVIARITRHRRNRSRDTPFPDPV